MKIIDNVHDLLENMRKKTNPLYLNSSLYDWLLLSNWNCVLGDKVKDYAKNYKVIRLERGGKDDNN